MILSPEGLIHIIVYYRKNPHRATVTLKGWKHHTCVCCRGQFRYEMEVTRSWRGPTPQRAHQAAWDFAHNILGRTNEPRPCPTCGLYQPDMLFRNRLHALVLVAQMFTIMPLLGLRLLHFADQDYALISFLAAIPILLAIATTWLPAALIGAGMLAHLYIEANHPNRNLLANLETAQALRDNRKLELTKRGVKPIAQDFPTGVQELSAGTVGAYMVLVAALLLTLAGEALRLAQGWPINAQCKPIVAGPGDDVQIFLPKQIDAVNGYWQAVGQANFQNAAELGVAPELELSSNRDSWGSKIETGEGPLNKKKTLWGKVHLPDDPKLAGQTVQIKIDLQIVYPKQGFQDHQNTSLTASHTATVVLAKDTRAGASFFDFYVIGGGLAIMLTLAGNLVIAIRSESLRSKALPSELQMIEGQHRAV